MDKLDVRILDALQQDGSLTQAQLAERVGSSPSTSLRRAQRLKKSGHLSRCVYLADPQKLERGLRAVITVVTSSPGGKTLEAFVKRINKEPAIDLAYGTTGEVDAVLLANFADMHEYREVCIRLLDGDPHVVRYTTMFAVDRYKECSAIPTDALTAKLRSE
jgi:Lrp/AsnC family transcriptional regulator, leucine-responsive regulatory protein